MIIIIMITIIIIIIIIIILEDQQCNARIRGGKKRVAGLYTKHKQKKMLQALWRKNVRTRKFKVHLQSSALRWHSPSALAAGGTGGPSPPHNAALLKKKLHFYTKIPMY